MEIFNLKEIDMFFKKNQHTNVDEQKKELLPNKPFHCYVVCNKNAPTEKILETIISSTVKEIDFCGNFAEAWEELADEVCVKHENNGTRNNDWFVITCSFNLDQIINSMCVVEEIVEDEENNINDVLIYDDESLKDFILKRVVQERNNEANDYITEEEQQMTDEELEEMFIKERLESERVELNCYTNKTENEYTISFDEMIKLAKQCDLAGLTISDYNYVQKYADIQKVVSKDRKYLKVLYGLNIDDTFVSNINVIAKNEKGKEVINNNLKHCLNQENKDSTNKNDINYQTVEPQNIIDSNRENLLIGLGYHSVIMAKALTMGLEIDINCIKEDIAYCDYVEIAPICAYKKYFPDKSDDEIKTTIKLIIDVAKSENKLIIATSAPCYCSINDLVDYSDYYESNNHKKLPEDYDGHIYTTEEMKYAMDWLDDDELVYEIVVTNTHKIMDMCLEL